TTGANIHTFQGYPGSHSSVAFSPDGARLLSSSSEDNIIKLWDAAAGALIRTFKGHYQHLGRGGVNSVAFSRDGTRILSGGEDQTIKLWNVATGAVIRTLQTPFDRPAPTLGPRPLRWRDFRGILARGRPGLVGQLGQHDQTVGCGNRGGQSYLRAGALQLGHLRGVLTRRRAPALVEQRRQYGQTVGRCHRSVDRLLRGAF